MSLSMYQASVPAFLQMLNNLFVILDKAEADAGNRKIDPEVLLNYRLAPDMFSFIRQIQIAADLAKGAAARLAGVEVPKHDDTEKTFPDLKARIAKTVTFVQSFKPNDIDGSEGRDITLTLGEHTMSFKPYLVHFVLPNFYFHCTTAYDILRHCGVELGKRDFHRSYLTRRKVLEEVMPTYLYRCEKCGKKFERIETISEHEKAKPGKFQVLRSSLHALRSMGQLTPICSRCLWRPGVSPLLALSGHSR